MKIQKISNFIILFIISFEFANCQQISSIGPGYKFELFRNTPIYELAKAVVEEDTFKIKKFVVNDSMPINYQEPKFRTTVLTLAILNEKSLSIQKLLEFGANPNSRSIDDSSPFLQELYLNNSNVLKSLINYGADVNSVQIDTTNDQIGKRKNFKTTALGIVCSYGNLKTVKILIENGAKVDAYGKNADAILSTAVLSNKLDIVKYLLIDVKAPIPEYVAIRQPGSQYERKMTITDILNESGNNESSQNQKLKQEILQYLKSIN